MSTSTQALNLLPQPRHLHLSSGTFSLGQGRLILLDDPRPQRLRFAASRLQRALHDGPGLDWETVASPATPAELVAVRLCVTPERVSRPQAYELSITPDGIAVNAHDEAGMLYALYTLAQIVEQSGRDLPCLQIQDWPDFPVRGVMLDVSRDKVPTMDTLFGLIDLLASWKINQVQLYTEHAFAYRRHPEVWQQASPVTGQDVLELDAFCRERAIDLVPNQNSFGHMHRWLSLPHYTPLAETTSTFDTPWGPEQGPFSLCPLDPGSLELVRDLFDELLPHFTSPLFNVGCDETFDIGQGRSREECARRGPQRVYLDFLQQISREVRARGRTMMFWGDIIVDHPELIPELPTDAVALEWGYEAIHPFDEHGARFAASGIPFYVCPGTSAWASLAGRTDNALGNLRSAAENGLKHGAVGYLITDWGDLGHWQPLPVSYLGFAAGAAYSWALEANRGVDLPAALDQHAFRDRAGAMGRVAYDLGNVYQAVGFELHNSSALFRVLQWPLSRISAYASLLSPDIFSRVVEAVDQAVGPLEQSRMARPDADLIRREFTLIARLLRHACRRAWLAFDPGSPQVAEVKHALDQDMQCIIPEFRAIWLERNRPGGLADSVARLERARADYSK